MQVMLIRKIFNHLLIFLILYQNAKNEAASSICSGEMADLKILQSEWLRALWPTSQEQHFSQTKDLCRNIANNINFHYRINSGKTNDQIFLSIQKNLFLAHFHNFLGTKKLSQKTLTPTDTRMKDGQTLFHRTPLPAAARGPTSTIAVDWHLRVTSSTKLFLQQSSPWCVIVLLLEETQCLVSKISRFSFFLKSRFKNLWRHHRHCFIMKVTLMLLSFWILYDQT